MRQSTSLSILRHWRPLRHAPCTGFDWRVHRMRTTGAVVFFSFISTLTLTFMIRIRYCTSQSSSSPSYLREKSLSYYLRPYFCVVFFLLLFFFKERRASVIQRNCFRLRHTKADDFFLYLLSSFTAPYQLLSYFIQKPCCCNVCWKPYVMCNITTEISFLFSIAVWPLDDEVDGLGKQQRNKRTSKRFYT